MANTIDNITITKDTITIDDTTKGKYMLVINTLAASAIIIMGVQSYNRIGLTAVTILLMIIGTFSLAFSMYMSFKVSFKKSFAISDVIGLKDKTAFTGHRSLRLLLANGRYRNLYLYSEDIPAMIKKMNTFGIKIKE